MIGILDSGVGGLSVARALTDAFPTRDIVYFGDTAKWPYGGKSPETIRSFAMKGAEFLVEKGARLLVVACHDISAVALPQLADGFSVEIVDAIAPAAAKAAEISRFSRIGVVGSRAVVESGAYQREIKSLSSEAKVHCVACPILPVLAMEGWLKRPETNMIVKKCIHPLKVRQIDTLIAASSELSLLLDVFARKAGKRVRLVESASGLVEDVAEHLKKRPELEPGRQGRSRFFLSDTTPHWDGCAIRFYRKNLVVEKVSR